MEDASGGDADAGRGRRWLGSLQRVAVLVFLAVKDFFTDDGPQWAASIAYYSLLSIFPLLLAAASIAAYFINPQTAINQATNLLGNFIPSGTGEIERVVRNAISSRTSASIFSTLALLWSGSRVFGTLTKALNVAYDVNETYGFLRRTLIEIILLLTIGFLFIIAVAFRTMFDVFGSQLAFLPSNEKSIVYGLFRQGIPDLLLLVTFFLVYRYVPRNKISWKASLVGTITATVLFLIARPFFLRYVLNISNFGVIYGSLTIAIILIIWAWVVGVILLLGGEIASHVQAMLIDGMSLEEIEERHLARSPILKLEESNQ